MIVKVRDIENMARKNHGGRPKEFNEELHSFVLRLPASVFEAVSAQANELGVSVNDLLLVAVSEWLERRQAPSPTFIQKALSQWKRKGKERDAGAAK